MIAFVEGLFQPLPSRRCAHQGRLIRSGGLKGLCLGVSTRVTEAWRSVWDLTSREKESSRIFAQSSVPACSSTASWITEEGLWSCLCLYFLAETRDICALAEPGPGHRGDGGECGSGTLGVSQLWLGRAVGNPWEHSIPPPRSGPTAPSIPSDPSGLSPVISCSLWLVGP